MGAGDEGAGQRVVDDARVADEDEHRTGRHELEALRLEVQAEEDAQPGQVPGRPALAQPVDAMTTRVGVAPEAARVDQAERRDPAQLAGQEPPPPERQPDGHPRLAAHGPQREVHQDGGGEDQRREQRQGDEGAGLDRGPLQPSLPAGAERIVGGQERTHARSLPVPP